MLHAWYFSIVLSEIWNAALFWYNWSEGLPGNLFYFLLMCCCPVPLLTIQAFSGLEVCQLLIMKRFGMYDKRRWGLFIWSKMRLVYIALLRISLFLSVMRYCMWSYLIFPFKHAMCKRDLIPLLSPVIVLIIKKRVLLFSVYVLVVILCPFRISYWCAVLLVFFCVPLFLFC